MNPAWILIVEDEFITASDLKCNLEEMGYKVPAIADTGESAIDIAGEQKPDLVLMDITLRGEMSGITAAEQIREKYNIPVIFLTAHSDETTFEQAKVTGPFGYIIKPFDLRNLRTSIETALYRHRSDEKIHVQELAIHALLDATGDAAALLTVEGNILTVNRKMATLLGRDPDELVNASIIGIFMASGIFPRISEEIHLCRSGSPRNFEERVLGRWFGITLQPVIDQQVIIREIALICHDITRHKATEHELLRLNEQLIREKEQLELFSMALNRMNDCVVITDGLGHIMYVNETFEKRYSYSLDAVKGKHISELAHGENRLDLSLKFFRGYSEGDWTGQFTGRSRFGVKILQTIKGSPVQYEHHRIKTFAFVLRDRFDS
ncbi:MAG: response regulator [Methanoregulaceae archaeon]|nr:response regulator [Methanoregulaceae archaeon]